MKKLLTIVCSGLILVATGALAEITNAPTTVNVRNDKNEAAFVAIVLKKQNETPILLTTDFPKIEKGDSASIALNPLPQDCTEQTCKVAILAVKAGNRDSVDNTAFDVNKRDLNWVAFSVIKENGGKLRVRKITAPMASNQ